MAMAAGLNVPTRHRRPSERLGVGPGDEHAEIRWVDGRRLNGDDDLIGAGFGHRFGVDRDADRAVVGHGRTHDAVGVAHLGLLTRGRHHRTGAHATENNERPSPRGATAVRLQGPNRAGDGPRLGVERGQPLRDWTSAMIAGITSWRSPITAQSALVTMLASLSVLIARMCFDAIAPTQCWMAPEMPEAM